MLTILAVLAHTMQHAKFQGHRPIGSVEDFFMFYHICAWLIKGPVKYFMSSRFPESTFAI